MKNPSKTGPGEKQCKRVHAPVCSFVGYKIISTLIICHENRFVNAKMQQIYQDYSYNTKNISKIQRNDCELCKIEIYSCKTIDKPNRRRYNSPNDSKGVDGLRSVDAFLF